MQEGDGRCSTYSASTASTPQDLRRDMRELFREAEGLYGIDIFRNPQVAPADPRIRGAVINWFERAMTLERSKAPLCLCCDTEFYPGQAPAAFSVLTPFRNDYTLLSLTGICRRCATRSDAALAEASVALARKSFAPDARMLPVEHFHAGGRA
jgi:hypothetical protein